MKYINTLTLFFVLLIPFTVFGQSKQNLDQQLLNAIIKRQPAAAIKAIESGANVNGKTSKGLPFIALAAYNGDAQIVKAMIDNSVNPNLKDSRDATALIVASLNGHLEIVEMLTDSNLGKVFKITENGTVSYSRRANLEDQDSSGFNALMAAASKGQTDVVRALLAKGAKINVQNNLGFTALMIATSQGSLPTVRLLVENGADINLENKAGKLAIDIANEKKLVAIRNVLAAKPLNSGNNNSEPKQTPAVDSTNSKSLNQRLLTAVVKEQTEVALDALRKGASVGTKNIEGMTVLYLASYRGNLTLVNELLRRSADVEARSKKGFNALIVASQNGHLKVMNALLRNGAKVDVQTNKGATALMLSALGGHIAAVRMLIGEGANINLKTDSGLTALAMAKSKNHTAIVNMLSRNTSTRPTTQPTDIFGSNSSAPCPSNRTSTSSFYLNGKIQTGLKVNKGDRLSFTATGKVRLGGFVGSSGPDGINGYKNYNLVRNANWNHGVLIARIKQRGNNDGWSKIGSRGQIIAQVSGTLELAVNDRDAGNNSGEFDVNVIICKVR